MTYHLVLAAGTPPDQRIFPPVRDRRASEYRGAVRFNISPGEPDILARRLFSHVCHDTVVYISYRKSILTLVNENLPFRLNIRFHRTISIKMIRRDIRDAGALRT